MDRIRHSVQRRLGFYVYLYVDPRDGNPFYVGKGKGQRALSHLSDRSETDKVARIEELRKLGHEPIIEILRYGLTQREALLIESAAIDLLGLNELTNRVKGHGFDELGRTLLSELVQELDAEDVEVMHRSILINISRMYRHGMAPMELYDATRQSWVVGPRRDEAEYAMAVFRGIVREVYEIVTWLPAGSTMATDDTDRTKHHPENRHEFIGHLAENKIRKRYLGKSVRQYFPPGSQNPIKYV